MSNNLKNKIYNQFNITYTVCLYLIWLKGCNSFKLRFFSENVFSIDCCEILNKSNSAAYLFAPVVVYNILDKKHHCHIKYMIYKITDYYFGGS